MSISLVIPVYNNENDIPELSKMLVEQQIFFRSRGVELEPILVIDGSPDNSHSVLVMNKKLDLIPNETKIVKLSKNFGQQSALLAGLETSTGNCVICYSADMQDPPELFWEMYKSYLLKNEIVLAVRSSRNDNWLTNFTSRIGWKLLKNGAPSIPKGGFDFFLIGEQVKNLLLSKTGVRRFIQVDIVNLGFSRTEIKYKRAKRIHGKSSYNFPKRLKVFADAFYDSSDLPIKLCTRFGLIISGSGLLSAVILLVQYFRGISPFSGFTAIITSILILGGVQLSIIGVIGEYIYRIFDIVRNKPRFIIESIE